VRKEFHAKFSEQYLANLDQGWGLCVLKRSELAKIVTDSLLAFDGQRYRMGSFVVMPNHVHLVVCLLGDTNIVKQCTSWKRFTATKINQALGTTGRFWQEESFDHLIRSEKQFFAINQYIINNPSNLPVGSYYLHRA
jgi:type I restriction enzyme R subunit